MDHVRRTEEGTVVCSRHVHCISSIDGMCRWCGASDARCALSERALVAGNAKRITLGGLTA